MGKLLDKLNNTNSFAGRHLGPNAAETKEMLAVIGSKSLDSLMSETIPDGIRIDKSMDIPEGVSEAQYLKELRQSAAKKPHLEIRVGIHTGPVVAGIIGEQTFSYDVWGDAVNTASRMESSGEPGRINISEKTYEMVRDRFECELRGHIEVKGLGPMPMYFVTRRRLTTSKGPDSRSGSFSGSGPEL